MVKTRGYSAIFNVYKFVTDFFINQANRDLGKSITGITDEVKNAFSNYHWPGNIRELKNIIKRAALLSTGDTITAQSIPGEILNSETGDLSFSFQMTDPLAEKKQVHESSSIAKSSNLNLKEAALEAEFETIMDVLKKVQFNKSKAARLLNTDRKTLYNKMKHYNLLGDKD